VSADELIIAINISHYLAARDWTRYGQQRARCCQFYVVSMQLVLPLLLLPLLFGNELLPPPDFGDLSAAHL